MKLLTGSALLLALASPGGDGDLPARARGAIERGVQFFREQVAVEGSYLWTYSEDLAKRRGEEEATATQGWAQPPGTPAVGMAFLAAHEATGDARCLEAAAETARALAATQLLSGGWNYRLEFDPEERRRRWLYRRDVEAGHREPGRRRNTTVFDDDVTQSALRFLMRADQALGGKDAGIRGALEYGLEKLLEAQYPNGGWPQAFEGEARDPERHPAARARIPEIWPRTWPGGSYRQLYTFNDGATRDLIGVLLLAHRARGAARYLEAARRTGDFILLAQLPEPQAAWAQQYGFDMTPAWARKFEPPAVSAGESRGVGEALIELYLETGAAKYLDAVGPAVEWFRRSRLPDGRWARFYELATNRPLYFNRKYELTPTADDLPTHYSFRGEYGIQGLIERYERVKRDGRDGTLAAARRHPTADELRRRAEQLETRVRAIIESQDARGRWVVDGAIRSSTFIRNLETLAEYLAANSGRALDRRWER